ncbi:MAG: S8 family peptidase [Chlorobiaceae bacterium]|jgi:Subtilase family
MTKRNFLLGKGERLTEDIIVKSGGGPKDKPYTFTEAKARLAPMLISTSTVVDSLPSDACPHDQAIISIVLNPEFLAKSYYPSELLKEIGVEIVGSRPKKITPEKRSKDREIVETFSTELFARGSRSAIRAWSQSLPSWRESSKGANDLISIEEITALEPRQKIKGVIPNHGLFPLEIVLHSDELESHTHVLKEFTDYLLHRNLPAEFGRRFFAKGLCFIEVDAPSERVEEIAQYSLVRAIRQMPELRLFLPPIRSSSIPLAVPQLPSDAPISSDISVAIFDGGIPDEHPLNSWVTSYEMPDMGPAIDEYLSHGVSVTSAALFGHINPREPLPRPYSFIDHYRVLDDAPNSNPHELYEVLDRIEGALSTREYDFISLSLGPHLPIEDDDVHAWTAVLDDRLSRTSTLAIIAVGNDGESDPLLGLNRIQVPADCVNALAIGACDSPDANWQRALYSSVGPGRSPGIIKPDLVEFGGVVDRPFIVLGPEVHPTLSSTGGTSFSAPSVVRLATAIRAHFSSNINHLAIRTLLIHTSEKNDQDVKEVGWGRVARNLNDVVLCDDDTIRVVYQGEISPAKYIRAAIPLPSGVIDGMVTINATICYKSQTDPHHPGNYTRAGLQLTFRPHEDKFTRDDQVHPNSASFFGSCGTGSTEEELRRDAWKWENCLHSSKRLRGSSLKNPCFDIHYNSRLEGRNFAPDVKLPYALVVTVQAKNIVDLYDQIVRKYANIIEPIRPRLEIPLRA